MTTNEIRSRFLEFFKRRGHKVVKSDSLVPERDPTLLFTGAGMNQFKEYFLGIKKDLQRAASSQKCLRTGDLDEVGRTPYHHSFFEMLGNFSFGDYFKKEAIRMAWEFLTEELKIPRERLRVSVHADDKEAVQIWRDEIKVPTDWIYKMGDKTNFWPSNALKEGPNGPCGPCSEIYFDQEPAVKSEDIEGPRFAEIWNLVFTQFDREEGGKLVPLKQKNIDTGMGLERLACIVQGKKTNFEIDIFQPLNQAVKKALRISGQSNSHLYAISDHLRAIVFAVTDGVIPSNEGRGYVIRKLIRRALWRAHQLGPLHDAFLYQLVPEVVRVMKDAYPELTEAEPHVKQTLKSEEERFLNTLETGLVLLKEKIEAAKAKKIKKLSGEEVFLLYDTYGFPDELTKNRAEKEGLGIDQEGFDRLMAEQRKRAKGASPIAGSIFATTDLEKKLASLPPTKFLGYQTLEAETKVVFVDLQAEKGIVVLEETPFYAESGGQVGDQGSLENAFLRARVTDTQKKDKCFVHSIEIEKGTVKAGDRVFARVDRLRRESAMRNHTATHLLHAALRQVLGKQVRQLGSLVSPEKLRFDYSYGEPLNGEQQKEIEDLVNDQIMKDLAVSKEEKPMEEAKGEGAIAFFGEKYGEKVRVVTVPGFSKELCGGTHCERTGQIGSFLIVSDSSIGTGTRRMEALTGTEAIRYARTLRAQILQLAQNLKTSPSDVVIRVNKLQEAAKKSLKEPSGRASSSIEPVEQILSYAEPAGRFKFLAHRLYGLPPDDLRRLSDQFRSKGKETIFLLASKTDEKIYYLLGLSEDLRKKELDLTKLFGELSALLGASGGGRKDLIQGGGTNRNALDEENWSEVTRRAIQYLCS